MSINDSKKIICRSRAANKICKGPCQKRNYDTENSRGFWMFQAIIDIQS